MKFSKKAMVMALATLTSAAAQANEGGANLDPNVVVVTASMRNQTLANAPAFTTVINAEDLAQSSYNSLSDALRETVGVNNVADTTGRDDIQIRGLGGKYTLILINGRRLSSSGALWRGGDFDLNSIPVNAIQRVEIVRGPMAALYGSDAMGGVVNIITKAPSKDWLSSINSEYRVMGSGDKGDLWRAGFSTHGALDDNWAMSLSGEISDRQAWYATSAQDTKTPPRLETKKTANLNGVVSWRLNQAHSLDLDFGYNQDKRPKGLYYYLYNPAWNYEARDYREQEIRRHTLGLTHKANWDWGTSTAYISKEESTIDDFNTRYNKPQQRQLRESNTYGKLVLSTQWQQHALNGGVEWREQVIKDPLTYLQTGRVSTTTSALFLEDEIAFTKNLSLSLAGRLDDSNKFDRHFSPKAYLVYQVQPGWTVKGGVSNAFKAPEAYQLSKEYSIVSCGGKCQLTGNPLLKPETSKNYELGTVFTGKDWSASAVLFKNEVSDMIVAYYDAKLAARRWINVAKFNSQGFEFEADGKFNAEFDWKANYTYLKAEDTDADGVVKTSENKPKHMLNLALSWKILPTLSSTLSAHHTGEQVYEEQNLPAYTRYDLGFAYRGLKQWTWRAGVRNLSNVNLADKNKQYLNLELGRSYFVSANYQF